METEIIAVDESPNYLMPAMTMQAVIQRRSIIVEFVKQAMKKGVDYGVIPGTDKPALKKPGAEKLCTLFGLTPRFTLTEKEQDWTGKNFDGEPMFHYQYRCGLWYQNRLVAEGEGSCNSREKKYRYRQGERRCPTCGKPAIIKGKAEYGGGWLCFAKKGGCGAKFADGDTSIEGQQVGQILNSDIADLVNTILKMAQKRALVAATLLAVNASEFFTQDLDDMVIEGDLGPTWTEQTTTQPATEPIKPTTQPPTENGKPASLKYQAFVSWANEWVRGNGKDYANADGRVNMHHLLARIGKLGFASVTAENADDIKAVLENFVKGKVDASQS